MIYRSKGVGKRDGFPIGILRFEEYGEVIELPGSVGNPSSYDFPVVYQMIDGYAFDDLCNKDEGMRQAVLKAARKLEAMGVRAITANCGFFGLYQNELAEELSIPVFLSSLLQVPFLSAMMGKKKIGILTADSSRLTEDFLHPVGITENTPVVIRGLQDKENFYQTAVIGSPVMDVDALEKEVIEAAQEMVEKDPNIGAFLLECSELPPFGRAIQEATELPVFDFYTMIAYVFSGVIHKRFDGFR